MAEIVVQPRLPYSLADSSAGSAGGTRLMRGGVLQVWDRLDGRPVRLRMWQRAGGEVVVQVDDGVDTDRVHERVRFLIAADVDPAPFLRMARRDPLARAAAWRWPGLRPMRLTSPAHAVLAAVCGQLVSGQEAARRHRAVLRAVTGERDGTMVPPDQAALGALTPARCMAAGLPTGRGAAMIRICRGPALERLADRPTARIVAAVTAVPGLGPWSAGVIAMRGFGRYEQGMVGDLGLMRLWAAVHGAWPAPEETASLLEPYGEWAGLAGTFLMRHPLASLGGRPVRRLTPRAAAASA